MTGVELITGGWFASAVIGKVVDLGRSYLGDNYDLHYGTREMLTNLESHLPRIQTVIEEAEKRQITSRGLATWLKQLKDAAYETEDVLDDFEAKRIRESIQAKGKVTEIASSSVRMVKTLIFSDNDLKKLNYVVKKLYKLCMGDLINTLQLTQRDKRKEHLDKLGSETSSNLAPGVAIFGRDREIELILDMILNVLYGDFCHQTLDNPNLQQGEAEGSNNFCSLPAIPRAAIPRSREQQLFESSRTNVRKSDAPEQSRNRSTTSYTIAKPISRREQHLLGYTSGTNVKKGGAAEQHRSRSSISTLPGEQHRSRSSISTLSGEQHRSRSSISTMPGEQHRSRSSIISTMPSRSSISTMPGEQHRSRSSIISTMSSRSSISTMPGEQHRSRSSISTMPSRSSISTMPSRSSIISTLPSISSISTMLGRSSISTMRGEQHRTRSSISTMPRSMTREQPFEYNSNQKLAVIPIVGVGGVGKTAVAKKIYNDERVKEHFALSAWVYVYENCDAKKIMQEILCSFDDRINPLMMTLDIVERWLKQTITNHRFLLILDDLRDSTKHIWSRLQSVMFMGR